MKKFLFMLMFFMCMINATEKSGLFIGIDVGFGQTTIDADVTLEILDLVV